MNLHRLWWELHHDHKAAVVLLCLWILAWCVVYMLTVLWWPRRRKDRGDRRPRWYKPRHRADTHEGVTIHSRPLLELMPAAGHLRHDGPDVVDVTHDVDERASRIQEFVGHSTDDMIQAAERDPEIADFEWPEDFMAAWIRLSGAVESADAATTAPVVVFPPRHRDTVADRTQEINRKALRQMLDDEPWVFDVTQRFPVLEVTAT